MQQLKFIILYIFDMRNRILAIDYIFRKSKSFNSNLNDFSSFLLKKHKLILLKYTQFSNLSVCKIIVVKVFKVKRLVGQIVSVDLILHQMFLTFLDVIIEEKLKNVVFAYRLNRNVKTVIASIYGRISVFSFYVNFYLNQLKIFTVIIKMSIVWF